MSRKIKTWDLYIDGQEDPIAQGVHKNHVSSITADLQRNGTNYTFVESKAATSSKFSKSRKNRNKKRGKNKNE